MPQFDVDVKAFINITVRADSRDEARTVADTFVENCLSATPNTVRGYNLGLPEDTLGVVVPKVYELAVDGVSDVVEDEYAEIFENHYTCDGCGNEWIDRYSCMVDDECPSCGIDVSPYHSEEIGL